jgi:hypothetical protein
VAVQRPMPANIRPVASIRVHMSVTEIGMISPGYYCCGNGFSSSLSLCAMSYLFSYKNKASTHAALSPPTDFRILCNYALQREIRQSLYKAQMGQCMADCRVCVHLPRSSLDRS